MFVSDNYLKNLVLKNIIYKVGTNIKKADSSGRH